MQISCNHQVLDLSVPKVMGIINLSSDSFYDGGKCQNEEAYLNRAEKLVMEGASILDLGAASTKPGSLLINEEEEWEILEKPITLLREKYPKILISVDTYNSGQVKRCADLGVNIINDISGGSWDEHMFTEIAKYDMAYVMMHIQGKPENMQEKPSYENITEEVRKYFETKVKKLKELHFDKILLDPGFGFGKTIEHNYELLAGMKQFQSLGYPILAGLSRKSLIFRTLKISPKEALNGTTALHMLGLLNGAHILRVHDVKEAIETIELFSRYNVFSHSSIL